MSYKYCPYCGNQLPPEPDLPRYYGDTRGTFAEGVPEEAIPKLPDDGPIKYDQTAYWKELLKHETEIDEGATRFTYPHGFTKGDTIIHMTFPDPVSPRGGLMSQMVQHLAAGTTPPKHTRKELETMGYMVDKEGKIVLVNDVPVGPIYGVLQYWGGERQHHRWHLAEPIHVDPNRKGNPCFIDEFMVAFKATWKDNKMMTKGVEHLFRLLSEGINKEKPIGTPRIVDICWVE